MIRMRGSSPRSMGGMPLPGAGCGPAAPVGGALPEPTAAALSAPAPGRQPARGIPALRFRMPASLPGVSLFDARTRTGGAPASGGAGFLDDRQGVAPGSIRYRPDGRSRPDGVSLPRLRLELSAHRSAGGWSAAAIG